MELLEKENERLEQESKTLWEDFRKKGVEQVNNLLNLDPDKVECRVWSGRRIEFYIKQENEGWDLHFYVDRELDCHTQKYLNKLNVSSFDCDLFSNEYKTMSDLINLIKEKYGDILKIMEIPEEINQMDTKIYEINQAINDLKKAEETRVENSVKEKIIRIFKLARNKKYSICIENDDYKDISTINDNKFVAKYITTQKTWSVHPKEFSLDPYIYSIARNINYKYSNQCHIRLGEGFVLKGYYTDLDECIKFLESQDNNQ